MSKLVWAIEVQSEHSSWELHSLWETMDGAITALETEPFLRDGGARITDYEVQE